jgi:hypothetical protein
MKLVLAAFGFAQALMAVLFALIAIALTVAATLVGWNAVAAGLDRAASQQVIEAMGLLAAAVVALQIAQTIAEEEVLREVHVSAPTRVRRFLSRFLVVLVVALVIEGLVATMKALHEDMSHMIDAAALLVGTAALLAGWGLFVRFNRLAEDVEPEAMEEAKEEDEKLRPRESSRPPPG